MKISIVIPVLNEAPIIEEILSALQPYRLAGAELIVVDGGSTDASVALSQPLADRVMRGPQGRARQMNVGAEAATGEILLFLHADTRLPATADQLIVTKMERHGRDWGRFDVRLSGRHLLLRLVEGSMNLRSRLSGIATGDQAIFVRREVFKAAGGFPEIDLMEDITLSRILKRHGPPLCLWQRVTTSSRRWEENGYLQTLFLMWYLRLAYFFGASPGNLARLYGRSKEGRFWT